MFNNRSRQSRAPRSEFIRFAFAVLFAIFVFGPGSVAAAPFQIGWIHGTCRNCQTARYLLDIACFSATEAWALGFNPPGEAGAGDATVLHSRDGGHTWFELHRTYTHNGLPTVSLAGPLDGWLMYMDGSTAAQRLSETHDGGRHWHRRRIPDDHLQQVEYLGHGQGVAYAFDFHEKIASLYMTSGPDRWRKIALPPGFAADQMNFTDLRHGVLAGCRDHQGTVVTTDDGGLHWASSALDLRTIGDATSSCGGYEVDRVTADARGHAWLLVSKQSFMKGDTVGYASVWESIDNGLTWTRAFERRWDAGAGLSRMQGFEGPYLFGGGRLLLAHGGPRTPPAILYREPGGDWAEEPTRLRLNGCHPTPGALACAAGERGFWMALLSR